MVPQEKKCNRITINIATSIAFFSSDILLKIFKDSFRALGFELYIFTIIICTSAMGKAKYLQYQV